MKLVAEQPQLPEESSMLASGETSASTQLRNDILQRFLQVDANNDSVVTMEEMREGGLGQATGEAGELVLHRMLAACAGNDFAENCSRSELQASLARWGSHQARLAVRLLMGATQSFVDIDRVTSGPIAGATSEKCGAGLRRVGASECYVQGRKCWKGDDMAAWALKHVCSSAACVCMPTPETQRFAKLGVAGAVAVSTVNDFNDPAQTLSDPACGGGWRSGKLVGTLRNLRAEGKEDSLTIAAGASWVSQNMNEFTKIVFAQDDETEVGLFRSDRQQLRKNGHTDGKVCMISWQATRTFGDWKTNFMIKSVNFPFAPPGVGVSLPHGLVLAYSSVRESLKKAYEDHCCSSNFTLDKLVISGHSHGGALAIINAIDVVSHWQCGGRDIGADDIVLVTAAPHKNMLDMAVVNDVFSCSDKARCLAGSVVTLVSNDDVIGDDRGHKHQGEPFQPSVVTFLPCPAKAEGTHFLAQNEWWCHGIFVYTRSVENALVDGAGWGSTCGGECGDLNRQLQCVQYTMIKKKGCIYADPSTLKPLTKCDPSTAWNREKEMCTCWQDTCGDLTTLGCLA